MAPITPRRTPRKQRLAQLYSNKRKQSVVGRPSKRRKLLKKKQTNKQYENSIDTRKPRVKAEFKKSVSFRKKKEVRVTKKFKEKVTKALEPGRSVGWYMESGMVFEGNSTNGVYTFPNTFGDKQIADRINSNSSRIAPFSPLAVLDAASVLFNGKVASENNKFPITGTYPNEIISWPAGTFDQHTAKIMVKNSYTSYVIKNNTNRTVIMQLYECAPKFNQDVLHDKDVYSQWQDCLADEATIYNGSTVNKKINLSGATVNTLYSSPFQCKKLMQRWKIEKHEIILDPGQTYDHYMQGPQNVEYDYSKFWKPVNANFDVDNCFMNLQSKFTRQLMFTARLDLVNNGSYGGRLGIPLSVGGGLLFEYKHFYRVSVPEQTGGSMYIPPVSVTGGGTLTTAQTTSMTDTQKRDCFYLVNWSEYSGEDPTVRYEEQTGTDNQ